MSDEIKSTTIQFAGRVNRMFEQIRLAQQIVPTKSGLANWLVEEEYKRRFPGVDLDTFEPAAAAPADAEGGEA